MHICSCPTNSRQLGVWAQHVPTLRDLMGIHVPWLMKVKTVRSCKTTFNDAASMLLSNIFVFCMRALRWRNWGVCGLFSIGSVPWPSHDIRPMELWSGGCSLVWNCSKSTCRMIPSPSNAIRKDGSMHPRSNLSVSNPPHLPSGLKLNQTQPTHARYPTSPEPRAKRRHVQTFAWPSSSRSCSKGRMHFGASVGSPSRLTGWRFWRSYGSDCYPSRYAICDMSYMITTDSFNLVSPPARQLAISLLSMWGMRDCLCACIFFNRIWIHGCIRSMMHRSMLSPCVWLFARLPYHSYLFVYLYNLYSSTHVVWHESSGFKPESCYFAQTKAIHHYSSIWIYLSPVWLPACSDEIRRKTWQK